MLLSGSGMYDSLQPHGLQHTRLLGPPLFPRVCANSCLLRWWCHPTIILCQPLLFLPSIFPSIRVFSSELAFCIRWPKYWSFSISPSNAYSRLSSVRMDLLDLLAVHLPQVRGSGGSWQAAQGPASRDTDEGLYSHPTEGLMTQQERIPGRAVFKEL